MTKMVTCHSHLGEHLLIAMGECRWGVGRGRGDVVCSVMQHCMSTAWPFKLSSGECATIFWHLVGGWDTVPSFPRALVRTWVGAWVSVLACMGVCLSACKYRSITLISVCSCHRNKSHFRRFLELRHGSRVGDLPRWSSNSCTISKHSNFFR